MIDELGLILENRVTDKKGNIDWERLYKNDSGNKAMMDHITEYSKR